MADKDLAEKYLESFSDVFADIYNVLLFRKEILLEEGLEEGPTESIYKVEENNFRNQFRPAPAHPLPADLLHHLYLITPNETEAEMITGVKITDDISAVEAARVLSGMGVQHVIITLGSKGALICSDGEAEIVPALKVEAVDTTAAGDVFNGALTVALSEGRNLKESVRFACKASAISVTRVGAQSSAPYRNEVDIFD